MKYSHDNLADALQAMKHGIELFAYPCDDLENFSLNFHDLMIENECEIATLDDLRFLKNRFFVSKESEHLLGPQKNDKDKSEWIFTGKIWEHDVYPASYGEDCTTTFRNGLYFPQPKILGE